MNREKQARPSGQRYPRLPAPKEPIHRACHAAFSWGTPQLSAVGKGSALQNGGSHRCVACRPQPPHPAPLSLFHTSVSGRGRAPGGSGGSRGLMSSTKLRSGAVGVTSALRPPGSAGAGVPPLPSGRLRLPARGSEIPVSSRGSPALSSQCH